MRLGRKKTPKQQLHDDVITALKTVYDPEIPVNIYDLGLIYDVAIADDGKVNIQMTLTAPGCPFAQPFPGSVASSASSTGIIARIGSGSPPLRLSLSAVNNSIVQLSASGKSLASSMRTNVANSTNSLSSLPSEYF